MGTVAFVFPGQGSQKVGMARDLWEAEPVAREVLERADAALGWSLTRLMFEGPEETLTATENAQPAIVAHSAACLALLEARGLRPALVAGHSLGEYAAVLAAGSLSPEEAVCLVRRRGELMARAGAQAGGMMAAVLGLEAAAAEAACAEARKVGVVVVANYNCPGQVVLSGEVPAVEEALRLAKAVGAKRAVPLRVSGAFHSPLMAPAAEEMGRLLDEAPLADARVPIVSNVDAAPRADAVGIRAALAAQFTGAVRWEMSLRVMADRGISTFIEVGPGAVLAGLIRRTLPEAEVYGAGTVEEFQSLPGGTR